MLPTSISQILESLVNAVIAISMGAVFIRMFATDDNTHLQMSRCGRKYDGSRRRCCGWHPFYDSGVCCQQKLYSAEDREGPLRCGRSWGDVAKTILFMLTPVIFSTFSIM